MPLRTVLAALVLAASLAVPAVAQLPKPMKESEVKAAGGRQVPGAELRQKLVGNTAYHLFLRNIANLRTGDVSATWWRDGRSRVLRGPKGGGIEGVWWLDADSLCVEQPLGGMPHQCYSVWELRDTTYQCVLPEGDCIVSLRFAPGNPEGL
jgi:hypothetical protein